MWTGKLSLVNISYIVLSAMPHHFLEWIMNLLCFSGKTTLSKAVSTVASTAAFDKNPQSKERGITLDLGFSSFTTPSANHIQEIYPQTQYTLVDCPGHGKNIIGDIELAGWQS